MALALSTLPNELQMQILEALPVSSIEAYLSFLGNRLTKQKVYREIILSFYDLRDNIEVLEDRFPDHEIDWKQILTYLEEKPKPSLMTLYGIWDEGTPYTKEYFDYIAKEFGDEMEEMEEMEEELVNSLWSHAINAADLGLESVLLLFLSDPRLKDLETSVGKDSINSILRYSFGSQTSTPEILLRLLSIPEISSEIYYDDLNQLRLSFRSDRKKQKNPKYGLVIRKLLANQAFREPDGTFSQDGRNNPLSLLSALNNNDILEEILFSPERQELVEALKFAHTSGNQNLERATISTRSWFEKMFRKYGKENPTVKYILSGST
jgi:hypothetical protein